MITYGYEIIDGKTKICDREADMIKFIFSEYISGKSLREIANYMTENGVIYFNDKTAWNKSTVSRIIENKNYLGNNIFPQIISHEEYSKANKRRTEICGKKAILSDVNKSIKSKLICGRCNGKYGRKSKSDTREKWHCTSGCNCSVYIDDTTIQNALLKAVIKMSENADIPESHNIGSYSPTVEVTRKINEINRMMEKTDMSFNVISNKILECASAKFEYCEGSEKEFVKALVDRCKNIGQIEDITADFINNMIKSITIFPSGDVSVCFIGGLSVGVGLKEVIK
ncbi:MAG: recombinase family protein [Synergistaceae bacterium]|nr:recombinase family protein [Synergistaceae bacterium]